ncbi:tetratricopeptide repeat protein [Hydrocarboniphaga sp.]|uniref:tetratricopeptide repeat protein n=1 Tax=Hydrocarboniphaga sp. TaxID=2033016 RepID=UPI003D0EE7AC
MSIRNSGRDSGRISGCAPASLLLASLMLAGCASTQGEHTSSWPDNIGRTIPAPTQPVPPPRQPVPITPGTPVPGDPSLAMIPPPKTVPTYPKAAEDISSQAVVSLMKQARTARAAGQFDQASGALERAQRIEPRNYFVWSSLARVYLDKKDYDNAESVALKSNSLARGNIYVELENWKIIAAARQAQGDAIGALQAQGKADEIQRGISGG